jgi:hypothetical protein
MVSQTELMKPTKAIQIVPLKTSRGLALDSSDPAEPLQLMTAMSKYESFDCIQSYILES